MTFSTDVSDVIALVLDAEQRSPVRSDESLFAVARELGWPLVAIDEARGGSGGSIADLAEIAAGLGRCGPDTPILETAMAQWIHSELSGTALELGAGPICHVWTDEVSLGRSNQGVWIEGSISGVQWLSECEHLILLLGDRNKPCGCFVVERSKIDVFDRGRSRSGIPLADAHIDRVQVEPTYLFATYEHFTDFRSVCVNRSATIAAAFLVGAAQRACELTSDYVCNRNQFGAPLIRLQAVAQLLAEAACERDLMISAVRRAIEAQGTGVAAAAAAGCAARSAGVVASKCHQLHGAIGITSEYPLHLSTRRLWFERDRHLSQREAELTVGTFATTRPEEEVWDMVVDSHGGFSL